MRARMPSRQQEETSPANPPPIWGSLTRLDCSVAVETESAPPQTGIAPPVVAYVRI